MNSNTLALYSWGLHRLRFNINTIAATLRIFEAVNNQKTLIQTVFKFFINFSIYTIYVT